MTRKVCRYLGSCIMHHVTIPQAGALILITVAELQAAQVAGDCPYQNSNAPELTECRVK